MNARQKRLKEEIDSISDRNSAEDFTRMLPWLCALKSNVSNVMTDAQLDAKPDGYTSTRELLKAIEGGRDLDGESMEKFAINVLKKRVYDDVRAIAKDVLRAVMDGEVEADDVSDCIHEEVDSACIYTKDCYMYAWLLREADDVDLSGETGDDPSGFVTRLAYENLRAEVSTMVQHSLDNAEWNNEDEEEDNGDAS